MQADVQRMKCTKNLLTDMVVVNLNSKNYMHRIGRTGRAKQEGKSILFFTRYLNNHNRRNTAAFSSSIVFLSFFKKPLVSIDSLCEILISLIKELINDLNSRSDVINTRGEI